MRSGASKKIRSRAAAQTRKTYLDAQRQYMVIGTLALLLIFGCVICYVSRAAAPEGTGGESVLSGDSYQMPLKYGY